MPAFNDIFDSIKCYRRWKRKRHAKAQLVALFGDFLKFLNRVKGLTIGALPCGYRGRLQHCARRRRRLQSIRPIPPPTSLVKRIHEFAGSGILEMLVARLAKNLVTGQVLTHIVEDHDEQKQREPKIEESADETPTGERRRGAETPRGAANVAIVAAPT